MRERDGGWGAGRRENKEKIRRMLGEKMREKEEGKVNRERICRRL